MIKCNHCSEISFIQKSGFQRGKQRYFCQSCNKYFTENLLDNSTIKSKKKAVTIYDIAKELGVSISTVSRALNNSNEININTKEAILKIAKGLNYHANYLALNLAKSQTKLIGLVIPELSHVFFSSIIMGAQEYLNKYNYNLLIMQSDELYSKELFNIRTLIDNRVDGLLISITKETNNFDHIQNAINNGIPVVLFNRITEQINCNKVVVNDYQAAFDAVEHLIMNGYNKIAHLSGPQNLDLCQKRLNGYLDALKKYDIPIRDEYVLFGDLSDGQAKIFAKYLLNLPNPPDSVFAINDPSAIEIYKYAKEKMLKLPQELGIVGFSNDPISEHLEPSLTTIKQPTREMGKEISRIILEQIKFHIPEYKTITLKADLVVRKSSQRLS
jgi:DNA-binding LacI/PurR family transcriptional regulator